MIINQRKIPAILAFVFVLLVITMTISSSGASAYTKLDESDFVVAESNVDVWLNLTINSDDLVICGETFVPLTYVVKKGDMYLQNDNSLSLNANSFALSNESRIIDVVVADEFDAANYEVSWSWKESVDKEFFILEEDLPYSALYKSGSIITDRILDSLELSYGKEIDARPATMQDIQQHYASRNVTPVFSYTISTKEHN